MKKPKAPKRETWTTWSSLLPWLIRNKRHGNLKQRFTQLQLLTSGGRPLLQTFIEEYGILLKQVDTHHQAFLQAMHVVEVHLGLTVKPTGIFKHLDNVNPSDIPWPIREPER